MTLDYRTVWISDTHLGSRSAQAAPLSRFLKYLRCERLYLVGDIVDMWRLRSRWYWPGEHNNVVRRILNHTKHGTDVVFIPGNHDEGARQFLNHEFGGVRILPYDIHETADGRQLFVTHGDQYDLVVKHCPLLSMVGSAAYDLLVFANRFVNNTRARFGWRPVPLSKFIKQRVKSACMYVSRFEEVLTSEAQKRDLDGVVCGHIHSPAVETEKAIQYFNCGDWVESCTALGEREDGTIELIDGVADVERMLERGEPAFEQPDPHRLEDLIRWEPDDWPDPEAELIGAALGCARSGRL